MAGVYFHISFCRKACHYCDFHFSTSLKLKDQMLEGMHEDLIRSKEFITDKNIRTIYFGGGTPSTLSAAEIEGLIEGVDANFNLHRSAEITLEGNPDDLTKDYLNQLKAEGINRLSIGIQSFDNDLLQWMNRSHNSAQAKKCIDDALELGFNLSADLIYGIPDQSDENLEKDISWLVDRSVHHISAYALTVEEKTALDHMVRVGKVQVDEEQQHRQHYIVLEKLTTAGYEPYELSNFALKGNRSQHNSSYWNGSAYLGIGPSAHSFNGNQRRWNVSHNRKYLDGLLRKEDYFEMEELSEIDAFNEYVMTALRLIEGVDLVNVKDRFGNTAAEELVGNAEVHLQNGGLERKGDSLSLSREGRFFGDRIASNLFRLDKD